MRQLISIFLLQELYWGLFIIIFGVTYGFKNDLRTTVSLMLYIFAIAQFVIFWPHRKLIWIVIKNGSNKLK